MPEIITSKPTPLFPPNPNLGGAACELFNKQGCDNNKSRCHWIPPESICHNGSLWIDSNRMLISQSIIAINKLLKSEGLITSDIPDLLGRITSPLLRDSLTDNPQDGKGCHKYDDDIYHCGLQGNIRPSRLFYFTIPGKSGYYGRTVTTAMDVPKCVFEQIPNSGGCFTGASN